MSLSITSSNSLPTMNNADISKEEVRLAVDAMIKRAAPIYMELIEKTTGDEIQRISRQPHKLSVYSLNGKGLDKEKYSINTWIDIETLQEKQEIDPLDQLLKKLFEQMVELKLVNMPEIGEFDVRFDKGIVESECAKNTNAWHFDYYPVSITMCYSSKKDWTTRVIDQNKISSEILDKIREVVKSMGYEPMVDLELRSFDDRLEPSGTPSQQGVLHNATRSCIELQDNPI